MIRSLEVKIQQNLLAGASTGELSLKKQRILEKLSAKLYPEAWTKENEEKIRVSVAEKLADLIEFSSLKKIPNQT